MFISRTHLSRALHWLTLSKTFTVTNHKVTPLTCVQSGFMNVNHAGHLLVLTRCTTGEHPKQLHVYDKHQDVLYQVNLPSGMQTALSAIGSASDMSIVVGSHGVWWIDQQGQVLRQYGQQVGEMSQAEHIIQHSKGPLLISEWSQGRVVVLSNEATLLQHLFDVACSGALHLDEQAGLLLLEQWNNEDDVNIKVFQFNCQFYLKTTRKLCLQDQG